METKNVALVLLLVMAFALVFTGIPIAKAVPDFEQFGPHVDQILMKFYPNEQAECVAFDAGEIDLMDSPLNKYWIDRWNGNPEIQMADYGGELGAFEIDINNNQTMLGLWDGWSRVGAYPWIGAPDTTNWIYQKEVSDRPSRRIGDFTFADVPFGDAAIDSVKLRIKCWTTPPGTERIKICLFDGTTWSPAYLVTPVSFTQPGTYVEVDVTAFLNTVTKINAAEMRIEKTTFGATVESICIDHVCLSLRLKAGVNAWDGWTRIGDSPWLDAADYPTNYIKTKGTGYRIGNFEFADIDPGEVNSVKLRVKCWAGDELNDGIQIYLFDGTTWSLAYTIIPTSSAAPGSYEEIDVTSFLGDYTKVNAAQMKMEKTTSVSTEEVGVDHAYLSVGESTSCSVNGRTIDAEAWDGWTRTGDSPWLNATDYPTNYIKTIVTGDRIGNFAFADVPPTQISSAKLRIKCWSGTELNDGINIYVNDGTQWSSAFTVSPTSAAAPGSYVEVDVTSFLDTYSKINAAQMRIEKYAIDTEEDIGIDDAYLSVKILNELNVDAKHDAQVDNVGRLFGFRHALAHLVERTYIVSTIMQGLAVPLYSMVPQAMGGYMNPAVIEMHPYNLTEAANILNAAGIVDTDSDGFRDWPGTSQHVDIDFVVRDDNSPGRKEAGDRLIWELTTNLPGAKFDVYRISAPNIFRVRTWVTGSKRFTLYTGGWSLGRDPDYLFGMYHSNMYWHPGTPPNYCNIKDLELDGYLNGLHYAQDFAEAKTNCWESQRVMAEKSLILGMYANSAPEAARVHYTGGTNGALVSPDDGENMYRGDKWIGFVNEAGSGYNSRWSFYNAHPEGHELAASPVNPIIVRYGFSALELFRLNPVYSEWHWDWEVMRKVYDSLFAVNPFYLGEDLEAMACRWQILEWDNAGSPATELVFELRDDIYFHDGVQLTAQDIYFTFVELLQATRSRGLSPPSFYSNLLDVNQVIIDSPLNVRVRMNSLSVFAFHWIGGNIILPRHVWGPIMMGPDMIIGTADDNTFDPETFSPDKQLIGSGPFKAYPHSIDKIDGDYYVPTAYAKLDTFIGHWGWRPDREKIAFANYRPDNLMLGITKENYHRHVIAEHMTVTIKQGTTVVSTVTIDTNKPAMIQPGNKPGVKWEHVDVSGLTPGAAYTVEIESYDTCSVEGTRWPKTGTALQTFAMTVPIRAIQGDINDDGIVDVADSTIMSVQFGLRAWVWNYIDVNEDNIINLADASIVIRDWSV